MGNSILVDGYSTVNELKLALSSGLQEGSATVMAVTVAQLGRHSRYVGFKQGELAGNRQVKNSSSAIRGEGAFPVLIRRV
jgi:hypothetical protein